MSKVYSFKTVQKIPISLDKAWTYFSNPANLANITPDNMGFKTISKYHGDAMYAGQVIDFKVIDGGVEMTDIVHYKLPMWFLGDIANALFVKKQLNGIFDYRFKKVAELFGIMEHG